MNFLPIVLFIFVISTSLLIGGLTLTSALAGVAVWSAIVIVIHIVAD
jgi:hypothetical protein